jgi:hypothetical protein
MAAGIPLGFWLHSVFAITLVSPGAQYSTLIEAFLRSLIHSQA